MNHEEETEYRLAVRESVNVPSKRVWWADPDDGVMSGFASVVAIRGEIFDLLMEDGSEVEALANELRWVDYPVNLCQTSTSQRTGENVMNLVSLLNAARAVCQTRNDSTQYCGWGTSVDQMADNLIDNGVSPRLVNRVLRLAFFGYIR
jgi:hypothetical protein